MIKHDYFSPANLSVFPERYVIAGFIAADGCITHNHGHIALVFNISVKDRGALSMINNELAAGTRSLNPQPQTNSLAMFIRSEQICNDLLRLKITPRKTQTLRLPD